YGPSFLVDDKGDMRGVDWGGNAWGGLLDGLYFPWDKDNQIAKKVCEVERIDYYSQKDFILEGWSIHVDGEGTLVTTEE
ncbi:agmatine deiminase family protein, partial [Listeria monocytogenes]|nr:agmatine deiminase family protein [Listeria monocytogenes]